MVHGGHSSRGRGGHGSCGSGCSCGCRGRVSADIALPDMPDDHTMHPGGALEFTFCVPGMSYLNPYPSMVSL